MHQVLLVVGTGSDTLGRLGRLGRFGRFGRFGKGNYTDYDYQTLTRFDSFRFNVRYVNAEHQRSPCLLF